MQRLSELGDISRGVTYKSPDDLRPAGAPRSVQLLRATNIQGATIDLADVQVIDADRVHDRQRLATGDIAICIANGSRSLVGKAALIDIDRPHEYVVGAFCARFRPRKGESSDLIGAILETGKYRAWIDRLLGTTTINNLKPSDIVDCPVLLPSDQRDRQRLGDLLRTSRSLLHKTDALIAAKREQKRGLMQQLLTGKVRFPGFTEPWKTVRLGELGLIKSGGTPATGESEYWGGPHAWCTPTDVTALQTRHLSRTSRTITDAGMRASAAELLPPKSVIVCTRATVGIAAINTVPMSMNQGFKAIVPRRDVDGDFLYYAISHAKTDLLRRAAGSTFIEVSMTSFKDIPIRWPSSFAEQRRIATLLAGVDLEIELLSSQRAAFAMQRRGLMENLLSGDITIPSSDTSAA